MTADLKNIRLLDDLDANSNKITNVAAPTAGTDVATKDYVDNNIGSLITVGAGGDYSSVRDAVLAGEYNLAIVGAVTESASFTISSDLEIKFLVSVTWDIGGNVITYSVANQSIRISGPGKLEFEGKAAGSFAGGSVLGGTSFELSDMTVENTVGATANRHLVDVNLFKAFNTRLKPANANDTMINVDGETIMIDNCVLEGPGLSSDNAIVFDYGYISNLVITGTFPSSGSVINNDGGSCVVDGIFVEQTSSSVSLTLEGSINNIRPNDNGNSQITYKFPTTSSNEKKTFVNNCMFRTILDSTTSYNIAFNNCYVFEDFLGNTTNSGTKIGYNFTNCHFEGNIDLTGDNHSFSNCIVGPVNGGSAVGLAITAACTNTSVTGCKTDTPIADLGTNTSLSNNTTY